MLLILSVGCGTVLMLMFTYIIGNQSLYMSINGSVRVGGGVLGVKVILGYLT